MFKQSCIINICSEDIKNELKNIGYLYNSNGAAYGNNSIIYTNGDNFYVKKDYKSLVRDRSKQYIKRTINCGKNKDLFLAIAAMNDESDYMQWFVTEANQSWVNIGTYMPKGSLFQCLTKHRYPEEYKGMEFLCSSVVPAHKATVEELIEYFNKNGLQGKG